MSSGSLTVVGTGLLVAGHVTQESLSFIENAEELLYIVSEQVTARWLESVNPAAQALTDSYQVGRPRSETYEEIVERILAPVREGKRVVVAFYGHPGVFCRPGHVSVKRARAEGFPAQMLPGVSAEDCLIADLGMDPGTRGIQAFEATDFLIRHRSFDSRSMLVLWQIGGIGVADYREGELWNREGLAVLSRALQKHYPSNHEVIVYESAVLPVSKHLEMRMPIDSLATARATTRSTLVIPPLPDTSPDTDVLRELGVLGTS
jgi:hypothetical protein